MADDNLPVGVESPTPDSDNGPGNAGPGTHVGGGVGSTDGGSGPPVTGGGGTPVIVTPPSAEPTLADAIGKGLLGGSGATNPPITIPVATSSTSPLLIIGILAATSLGVYLIFFRKKKSAESVKP